MGGQPLTFDELIPAQSQPEAPLQPDAKTFVSEGEGAASFGFDKDVAAAIYAAHQAMQKGHLNDVTKDYHQGREELIKEDNKFAQDYPYSSLIAKLTGGLPTAEVGGPEKSAGTALGRVVQAGKQGAVQMGLSGAGNSSGDLENRVVGAGIGAAQGAATGTAMSTAGSAVKGAYSKVIAPATTQSEIEGYIKNNLPVTPGQVIGGGVGAVEKLGSQAGLTGAPIRDVYGSQKGALQERIHDVSGVNPSTPVSIEEAGKTITGGLANANDAFIKKKSALYNRAWAGVDNNVPIQATRTQKLLQDTLDQYGTNAALKRFVGADKLQTLVDVFKKDVPLGVAKTELKSNIWDMYQTLKNNDQGTLAQKFKDAYFALDNDIVDNMTMQNPKAGARIKAADDFLTQRMKENENLTKFFDSADPNKVKAADAYTKAVSMTQNGRTADSGTLALLKQHLPPGEWDKFTTYHLSNLGSDKAGQFLPNAFAKAWNSTTPEAKALLISDPARRQAFDNLAQYGKLIGKASVNPSGTGAQVAEGTAILGFAAGAPHLLAIPATNWLYGKLVAGQPWAAKAVNSLPRDIMSGPITATSRGMFLTVLRASGAPQAQIDDANNSINRDQALDFAKDAISRGANRDQVIQRLKQRGIDPGGL